MSKLWWQQRERGNVLAMKLISHLSLRLGRRTGRALLYPICLYFVLFAPVGRRASRDYLRRVFGRAPSWREVFAHHYSFASVLLDRAFLLAGRCELFAVERKGAELIFERMQRARGCLLLGAHYGSFDLTRVMGAHRYGHEVTMLMYQENAKKLNAVIASLRGPYPMKTIPIGGIEAMLRAQECVDAGGIIGMLGDRVFASEKTVTVPFFGAPVTLPAGPFLIAKALKIPIVLFFVVHKGNNEYEEHFELLTEEVDLDRRHQQRDLEKWARAYAARLEYFCRLAPYNWFNFYDYWHDRVPAPTSAPAAKGL